MMARGVIFVFDDAEMSHLRAVWSGGGTITQAAREAEVNRQTYVRAIKRSEFEPEVAEMYPYIGIKREKLIVNESVMEILRDEAEKGGSLRSAAARVKCKPYTLSLAARHSRFYDEALTLFPAMKRKREEATRPTMGEQLDRSQLHVRAATMKWRQAA